MNKLGHSESYSFSLELKTALAETLEEAHTILTSHIIQILIAHHYFAVTLIINFDQLLYAFLVQVRFTPATG